MTQAIKEYFTRPLRQTYYHFDLGPSVLFINGRRCIREDFHILNRNNNKLVVSFYHFEEDQPQNTLMYLHTHNGSKLQAVPLAEYILALGVNLCIFDFAGYGNSEGKTVSLGSKEMWDIDCVIEHLKDNFKQCKFILWGRSMGAVAGLLYLATKMIEIEQMKSTSANKQLLVIGGIYDSPFHSLEKLTLEIGSKTSKLPQFMMAPLVYLIKSTLKQEINFEELQLVDKMKHIKVPGIFLTSHHDNFVDHSHSEMLYKEYGGKKQLIYIEKDHNQIRKDEDLLPVFDFIKSLHEEHPKRWQSVLMNNLNFQRKNGKSIFSLYTQSNH